MKEIYGLGLNKLCAIGKIHFYRHSEISIKENKTAGSGEDISTEIQRLEIAFEGTMEELYDGERSEIHEKLHESARLAAFEGYDASDAVSIAAERIFASLSHECDPYISETGTEIRRTTAMLLSHLSKEKIKIGEFAPRPVILASGNIPPKELLAADRAMIIGIFLWGTSPVSELVGCAYSLGVPLIIGNEEDINDIPDGEMAIIDSEKGTLIISPEEETVEHYAVRLGGIALGRGKNSTNKRIICHMAFFEDNVSPNSSVLLHLREEKSAEELFLFFTSLLSGGELKINLPHEEKRQREIISAAIKASEGGKITLLLPSAVDISAIRALKFKLYSELEQECKNISVGAVIDCGVAAVLIDEIGEECDFFAVDSDKLMSSLICSEKVGINDGSLRNLGHKAFLKMAEDLICAAEKKGISLCFFGITASNNEICEKLIRMGADEVAVPLSYL